MSEVFGNRQKQSLVILGLIILAGVFVPMWNKGDAEPEEQVRRLSACRLEHISAIKNQLCNSTDTLQANRNCAYGEHILHLLGQLFTRASRLSVFLSLWSIQAEARDIILLKLLSSQVAL
jgi:hypothetical protein